MSTYADFLAAKSQRADGHGFEPTVMPDHLFDFQSELVQWAVRQGRAAIFADCGMGKTPMELAWAQNVHEHTGKPVLLLTPLAVGFQIVQEAAKFGHEAAQSRNGKAAAAIGELEEAQAAYGRAIELETDSGEETDAPELLAALEAEGRGRTGTIR